MSLVCMSFMLALGKKTPELGNLFILSFQYAILFSQIISLLNSPISQNVYYPFSFGTVIVSREIRDNICALHSGFIQKNLHSRKKRMIFKNSERKSSLVENSLGLEKQWDLDPETMTHPNFIYNRDNSRSIGSCWMVSKAYCLRGFLL